jgi:hypothetical protein
MCKEGEGCQPDVVAFMRSCRELESACRGEDKDRTVEQDLSSGVSWDRRVIDDIEDGLDNDW